MTEWQQLCESLSEHFRVREETFPPSNRRISDMRIESQELISNISLSCRPPVYESEKVLHDHFE